MNIIFNVIREDTFWKILLFLHVLMAVALLAAVTLQAVAVLMSARQAVGNFIDRFSPVRAASYAARNHHSLCAPSAPGLVDVSQVPPLRQDSYGGTPPLVDSRSLRIQGACHSNGHWSPSGLLVFLAAAPDRGRCRRAQVGLTVFLAFTVWYAFLSGHVANDFRGIGS
jgi:hypothetical protein